MKRYIPGANKATYTHNGVTYTGFDPDDNGKIIINTKGDWTYIDYQKNEWGQVIFGYIVANTHGFEKWKYLPREDQNKTGYYAYTLEDEYNTGAHGARIFEDLQDAIDYMVDRCKQEFNVSEVIYAD